VRTLAAFAALTLLTGAPAQADARRDWDEDWDKHRRLDQRYTYGQIVSHCSQRANSIGLGGHDRREFVDWCVDRGRHYAWRDWERRDWDRIRYVRDLYRYDGRYRYGGYRRDDPRVIVILDGDPYWHDLRYRGDWRYAALQDFLFWSLYRD
jgi:hypothetical protein